MKISELNVEYKQMEYTTDNKMEILCEGKYKGYQFYILSFGSHPTAYVEIPRESILFYKKDDDIDISVHGGLTYSSSYLQDIKTHSWFIGWDYAHCFDYLGFYKLFPEFDKYHSEDKKWTTEEMFEDVVSVIEQIIKIDNK